MASTKEKLNLADYLKRPRFRADPQSRYKTRKQILKDHKHCCMCSGESVCNYLHGEWYIKEPVKCNLHLLAYPDEP